MTAAHLLEASADDITFAKGEFLITGTDRGVSLAEVARVAHIPHSYPLELELGLQESAAYDPPGIAQTFDKSLKASSLFDTLN